MPVGNLYREPLAEDYKRDLKMSTSPSGTWAFFLAGLFGAKSLSLMTLPTADVSKRDTEIIPLDEDIDTYFAREVLPFRPGAWIDRTKTKVGYEIPFTKTFYEYLEMEPADDIAKRIEALERSLMEKLHALFGGEQNE